MKKYRLGTKLMRSKGALEDCYNGSLSFPIYSCSSIRFRKFKDYVEALRGVEAHQGIIDPSQRFHYGRVYNPTAYELATTLAKLEVDEISESSPPQALLFPSGVMAIVMVLSALCSSGKILMPYDCYAAIKSFAEEVLRSRGIGVCFYTTVEELKEILHNDVEGAISLIFCESPSSLLFRFYDIREIVKEAKERGIITVADNSWATFVSSRPLEFGVDVVVYSATKYISGHSDALMGVMVTCDRALYSNIHHHSNLYGVRVAAYECFLVQRGLKTLSVRLRQHQENAIKVVDFLLSRPEVQRVLYPSALGPEQKSLWARDYELSNGLLGVIFDPSYSSADVELFLDSLEMFNIGLSWGGCASMVLMAEIGALKLLVQDNGAMPPGPYVRMFCGLEDCEDLLQDLSQAFMQMNAAKFERNSVSA